MRRYETIVIVRPNVAEEEIEAIISRTGSIIEDDGGSVIRVDKWGLRKLAYLINKENQGYYIYFDYASIPASVSEMERIFRIDDKILKYLTVKLADSCDPEEAKAELAKAELAKADLEKAELDKAELDKAAVQSPVPESADDDKPVEEKEEATTPVSEEQDG